MTENFTNQGALVRLVATLLRWSGRATNEVASAAGVDRAALSRYVRRAPGGSIGVQRLHGLLAVLGWGAAGPSPALLHRWLLDRTEDVDWMFGEVLDGRLEVAPLFFDAVPNEVEHSGHLLGKVRGAWLLLLDSPKSSDFGYLDRLLEQRNGLAKILAPYVVKDRAAYDRILRQEVLAKDLIRAINSTEESLPDMPLDVVRALNGVLKYMGWDQFVSVLNDAITRLARVTPEKIEISKEESLIEMYERETQARADIETRLRLRKLARENAAELAKRDYELEWPHRPDL